MNVIFISPQFPHYYYNFCLRLKERGARVLGIGDTPYDGVDDNTKNALDEYYYIPDLQNYEDVYRAVGFYTAKYGKIDWIESENEYWLYLEAHLRTDFNVTTGPKLVDMDQLRHKSKMKDVYQSAGIPVAKYAYLDSLETGLHFAREVGYPVIVKPDDGMGASCTYKLTSDEEFQKIYPTLDQNTQFIVEDYVPGNVETFEGITDSHGNILMSTSHVMCDPVMDMVNEHLDTTFYQQPVFASDIYDIGERTVKAFGTKSRFFHFEFIRITEDKDYLGKKGDLVGLEVNMRAPGAYIPDMMNLAYDVDVYTIWADMILYDQCFYDINRQYWVGYAGRRKDVQYALSNEQIMKRYGQFIALEDDVDAALAEAMSDHIFLFRTKDKEKLFKIMHEITQHAYTKRLSRK